MQTIVAQAMTEGAVGLSAGLTYTPGMYADNDENFSRCAGRWRPTAATSPHTTGPTVPARWRPTPRWSGLTERSGCALHLAHATLNFGPNKEGRPNFWPCSRRRTAAGADISLDTYPYLPGATALSGDPAQLGVGRRRSGKDDRPANRSRALAHIREHLAVEVAATAVAARVV